MFYAVYVCHTRTTGSINHNFSGTTERVLQLQIVHDLDQDHLQGRRKVKEKIKVKVRTEKDEQEY